MKIKKYEPSDGKEFAKVAIYGTAGVGKTLAGCLAPKPLVISCEGGLLCLKQIRPEHREQLGLDVLEPTSLREIQEAYDMLHSGNHPYETVILDSLTEIQQMSLDEIVAKRTGKSASADSEHAQLQDYGHNTSRMRKFIRAFRDLNMNVVFTCLEMESKDERDGSIRVLPSLMPKLAEEFMGYMDIVGYMMTIGDKDTGKPVRKMLTQPWSKFRAKDRSGRLGMGLTNPTMYDIVSKINGTEVPDYIPAILKEMNQ